MANYLVNDTQLTSVADAIRAKTGSNAGISFPSGFVSAIGDIQAGGGTSGSGDVIFYDDLAANKIYASYTAAEFAALTAMPANPNHSDYVTHGISIPMTSQGWNWSLADAKAYVAAYGKLNIAQMYVPTDGKTHYVCYVPEDAPSSRWKTEIGISGERTWQVDNETSHTGTGEITIPFSSTGWHDVKVEGNSYYPYYYNMTRSIEQISKMMKIREVYIGSHVSKIGKYAFTYCYALASITIPSGATSIGNSAFYYCYSLASITMPSTVTSIETNAFYNCCSLTSITIPSSVTSIADYAFYKCYSLTKVTIPSGVTSIGTDTFAYCHSLTSITIPSTVTSIGSSAFDFCYALASITIPSGATSIGNDAFSSCYSLTSITIPSGVTSIGNYTFYYCYSLTSITIPSGVTSIGKYTFVRCYSLANITIPSTVTSIDNGVFSTCFSLTSITIPSSVTSIGNEAFNGCYSLTSITIPSGVTSIGDNAFYTCYSLASITMLGSIPPTLGSSAFSLISSDYVITVPAGSKATYVEATNWATYADHIVEAAE